MTDIGIAGLTGYRWQVSTGSAFATIYLSGTTNTSTTGIAISSLPENNYYRRTNAYDALSNTSARSTGRAFVIDYTNPIVGTGYISSGSTGTNRGNLYYKGTINIRAAVSDTNLS